MRAISSFSCCSRSRCRRCRRHLLRAWLRRSGRASSSRPTSAAPTRTTSSRWCTSSSTPTCSTSRALVSSPYGPGRREHILQVIDRYERDYAEPEDVFDRDTRRPMPCGRSPGRARSSSAGPAGFGQPDGRLGLDRRSRARATDPRPLYVLVWGGHRRSRAGAARRARHPAEAPRLLHRRAEQDVERQRLQLHRAAPSRRCGSSRPTRPIAAGSPAATRRASGATPRSWRRTSPGRGALGGFFATLLGGTIKMGDSPSVGYLLHGTPRIRRSPGGAGSSCASGTDGRRSSIA